MDVYLINFLKIPNSTSTPVLTNVTPNECQLKAPCSILTPVLELMGANMANHESITRCNYAYIPQFRRYYFIKNWTFDDNLIIAYLEVDVLATYKTNIKASTQYILRSAYTWDINVVDGRYPVKTTAPTRTLNSVSNPLQPAANDYGCFVVGIINKNISLTGCVSYYAMSYLVFYTFCQSMFNLTTQWGSDTTVVDGIKKAITDPFQYIVSIVWLPYSTGDFAYRSLVTSVSSAIPVGYDNVGITGTAYEFDSSVLNVQFTNLVSFTIPKHPDRLTRGEYLNVAPYSRYYLSFYPFCGEIELDSMALQGKTTLDLMYTVDLRTGKGILSICTDHAGTDWQNWLPIAPFRVIEAQVGVSIPVASIHTVLPASLGQMARNAAVGAVSEFQGFKEFGLSLYSTMASWAGKALGFSEEEMNKVYDEIGAQPIQKGDVTNIASNAAAMQSSSELIGSQGTMSFNSRMPLQFWGMFYSIAEDGNNIYGKPLCQYLPLTNFTGFIQCGNPRINAPSGCLRSEVDTIESYLSSGCFLD